MDAADDEAMNDPSLLPRQEGKRGEHALMADGPTLELPHYDGYNTETPERDSMSMPANFFDRGSSSFKRPSLNQNQVFDAVESTDGITGLEQFDMMAGFLDSVQTPEEHVQNANGQPCEETTEPSPSYAVPSLQHLSPPRSMLPDLQTNINTRGQFVFSAGEQQPEQHEQMDMPQITFMDFQRAVSSIDRAAHSMNELTAAIKEREEANRKRDENYNQSRDQLATFARIMQDVAIFMKEFSSKQTKEKVVQDITPSNFNWLIGHGAGPTLGKLSTTIQMKFTRYKAAIRSNSDYFLLEATEKASTDIWIQFDNEPRSVVDGAEIKDFLAGKIEMSEQMGEAVIRVMRRDEGKRVPYEGGFCHHVLPKWANKVMEPDASEEDCEAKFLQPNFNYDLEDCGRVVSFLHIGGTWSSLSIDLRNSKTELIHPGWAGSPRVDILNAYRLPMEKLTKFAVAHMRKLANATVNDSPWIFDVALKRMQQLDRPNTGISTAYYSIPKNNQFMHVCQQTMFLAKQTFIYEAQKLCYSVTHKPVMKRSKGLSKKRDRKGKLLANSLENSDEQSIGESGAGYAGTGPLDLLS